MTIVERLRRILAVFAAMLAITVFGAVNVHAQEEAVSEAVGDEAHEDEAHDEEEGGHHYPLEVPERQSWSFAGPFGTFDPAQLQRGLQVYRQVCAGCHGLDRVAFRTLADPTGPYLSEEQMRAVAAAYQVIDADTGERRDGRPADYFPQSNVPTAPDLSLMTKARASGEGFSWLIDWLRQYQESGANYVYGLLTGYGQDVPNHVTVPPGTFYNPYFLAGAAIGMPPPLREGGVTYADGTPATVEQQAADVTAFLMWTAEPKLVERKRLGFQVMVFLIVFAGLAYLTKRTIWAKMH